MRKLSAGSSIAEPSLARADLIRQAFRSGCVVWMGCGLGMTGSHSFPEPAEWSAAMLAQAALHTLDINEELIQHGFILKDATPSNVLFEGSSPVFVDVPSIEPLVPGRDVWLARHQLETTFLLPLIANLDAGLPIAWSLLLSGHRTCTRATWGANPRSAALVG